jgi:hypothetical protein
MAITVYLISILRMSGFLQDLDERIICHHVLHALQVVQCNCFAIIQMKNSDDFHHSIPEDIGQGVYLTLSFVNHSCDPSAEQFFYGNQCISRAIKVIKAGDDVCFDYGPIFTLQPKRQRQDHLRDNYFFTCQCVACSNNWPTFSELNGINPMFKCQGCNEPLPNSQASSKVVCTCCNQKVSILELIDILATSHDKYIVAASNAFHGKHSQALPCLLAHYTNMDLLLCQPWKEYYGCQATIKQCYRLLATMYGLKYPTTV